MGKRIQPPAPVQTAWRIIGPALGAGLFFLALCLCSAATAKSTAALLILLTLCAVFLFWERLRDRLTAPALALGLMVLMGGLSNLYAVAGKYALYEFLKLLSSFCLVLLTLAFTGERVPERRAASVLEGCCVIAGLVSVDLISTRWISTPVLGLLAQFTPDYADPAAVEQGVRILSMFEAPNPFAGMMGVGVLLSLGLAAASERPGARRVHLACLAVNSLAFVLAFSMGACAMIVPAFLVLLALTDREHRTGLFLLMAETLLVTLLCAFPISLTSMTAWDGVRPIPLACTIAGAAALCALDLLVGQKLADRLKHHGKAVVLFAAALLAGLALFLLAACTLTTGVTLSPGESLRRSAYPAPGDYTLAAEAEGNPAVAIESQNREDAMMHTSSELYRGPLSQAAFIVPEDSLVVWFTFRSEGETRLESVEYSGEAGSGKVSLGYRLLPGFIANRLQGLRANQNAIQRLVFFEDGLKLFRRSPLIGLGLGGFENGARGVQSFPYATKYVHNHYIQALTDTGIVGLALFLGLLAVSALAVWRGRKRPLAPALGGALVFMALHGAVEVDFSYYAFLPVGFGVFAVLSLCCGDCVPLPAWAEKKGARAGILLGICALTALFGVLLGRNIAAQNLTAQGADFAQLAQAAELDPFEKADYMLSYVVRAAGSEVDGETRAQADEYALRLGERDSNSIPIHLARYYLATGRTELGFQMAEQYVTYIASDAEGWQKAFALLEEYEQDTPEYRAGVVRIADLLDQWNGQNLGHIELDGQAQSFITRMRS